MKHVKTMLQCTLWYLNPNVSAGCRHCRFRLIFRWRFTVCLIAGPVHDPSEEQGHRRCR
ncbi:hypothetical protein ARMSODRAFT_961833 [Armillaria solidipes]|uniref:Uncharacterized protein n=1 Tax=Armillaria solidipes TaxID=1076256 RepID=A0A2H3BNN3_9AGAR|nr:hypothetical protein ARMSODRAFT_961833 [Armillaria solidipes]